MVWLTWRLQRASLAAGAAVFALLTLLLVVEGHTVHSYFSANGLSACLATHGSCSSLANDFNGHFSNLRFVIPLLLIVPLLAGMFWGAPLISREIEQGTHRLVWTQGITRERWTLTKIAVVALAAAIFAVGFAVLATWFATPFDRAGSSRLSPGIFDLQGIVPIAYTLFALALGAAVGAALRRALAATGATVAGFVGIRGAIDLLGRTHLLATRTISYPALTDSPRANLGDWVVKTDYFNRTGQFLGHSLGVITNPRNLVARCPSVDWTYKPSVNSCLHSIGLRVVQSYHPANQYWTLQAIESLVFVAGAAALVAFTVRWVRRQPA